MTDFVVIATGEICLPCKTIHILGHSFISFCLEPWLNERELEWMLSPFNNHTVIGRDIFVAKPVISSRVRIVQSSVSQAYYWQQKNHAFWLTKCVRRMTVRFFNEPNIHSCSHWFKFNVRENTDLHVMWLRRYTFYRRSSFGKSIVNHEKCVRDPIPKFGWLVFIEKFSSWI